MPSLLESESEKSKALKSTSQTWNSPWNAGAMEMARSVSAAANSPKHCAHRPSSANKIDSTVPWTLLVASMLFMLFKQYVNIVQLVEASKWLVQGDLEMRRKSQLQKKV